MNTYVIMIAEFALAMLLFFGAVLGRSKISFSLVLLVFGIFAQVSLIEIKLGPVSIRIYLAVLLVLIVAMDSSAQKNVIKILKRHHVLFFAFGLFYLWIPLSDLLADRVLDQGVLIYVKNYFSNYVTSVLFFIACIGLIRNRDGASFVAVGLITISFISAVFAVGQFLNIGLADNIYETLYPYETQERIATGTYGRYSVSGLSAYSISFVYVLLTFMPLAFSYALLGLKKTSFRTALVLGIFSIGAASSVLAQSRSGLLGFALTFLLITIMSPRIFKGVNTKNYLQIGIAVTTLCFVGLIVKENTVRRVETKYNDFSRMEDMWDQRRVNFAYATLTEVRAHPLLGVGEAEFTKKYRNPPHNTFLNAIIFFGLPGFFFCVFYHVYFVRIAMSELKNIQLDSSSWVTIGAFCGLFNYTWNGLTHNDSFITGGIFGFIVLGLFLAAREVSANRPSIVTQRHPQYVPSAFHSDQPFLR